ncbi:hypothetical protein HHI36_007700 [Cryptolaemus montrouzieri]|uniref:Little elongation complex subunit 2 C-terminal domain-containing protein n=1 Tax=Cryptolaemus montrouzieri TaxID=559131 RepID=A0ABD2MQH4_9CUCU
MKRLVRTNFCQYEAFRYEKQDTYPNEKLANFNNRLLEFEKKMNEAPKGKDEETGKQEASGENEDKKDEMKWKKKNKNKSDIIHHNANYRIWKFKKSDSNRTLMKNSPKNTELNLLVRSKLDGCELTPTGVLQPVVVIPKIELQLEYGANIPTKSELSREWTSLFFRPFSNLYRVRMHCDTAEVVSIEKCTLQKVISEANALYQYNPYLGLGMLNELLNSLVQLETGNYLLVHLPKHEHFVSVWKECNSCEGSLNLKSEYEKCEIDSGIKRSWNPIDLNYILPIHQFQKRLPGCFMPASRVFKKGGSTAMKKKEIVPKIKRRKFLLRTSSKPYQKH